MYYFLNKFQFERIRMQFTLLLTLLVILWPGIGLTQPGASVRDSLAQLVTQSHEKVELIFDERFGTISWLKGSFNPAFLGQPEESAYRFLETYRDLFQIKSPRNEFSLLSVRSDTMVGTKHVYFEQRVKGVPVWGHRLGFHYDRKGRIYAINGRYCPPEDISTSPSLSKFKAIQLAGEVLERIPYRGPATRRNGLLKTDEGAPLIFDTSLAPSAELIFFPDINGDLHLAYLVRLFVISPPGAWLFFIDAQSGQVLHGYNNIQPVGPAVGSGIDLFGNTIPLNTYLDTDGKYKLIDTTTYMFSQHTSTHPYSSWQGVIEIRDCNHALDSNGQAIDSPNNPVVFDPNGDNYFDDNGDSNEKTNYRAAVSLAKNFSDTYTVLYDLWGRNSVDGNGLSMIGNVHFGNEYPNAYWYPGHDMMFFGDAVEGKHPYPMANDVVAHEVCHGVTQFEVPPDGLIYENQSGALNEGYSDILGATLDYGDWAMGEDLGDPSRYYDDPTKKDQPKDMFDLYLMPINLDQGGVHYNSGISNYFFYLLSTSLPPESPASDGRFTASTIAYRSYVYAAANPYTTFRDWGVYIKQATIDLFGSGSIYNAVINALNAVHIPQAKVISYDNGQLLLDNEGSPYFFAISSQVSLPAISVQFDRPEPGAKLKTIAIDFWNPGGGPCTYNVWLCESNSDGSPDENTCQLLLSVGSSQVKVDGRFTNFKLENVIDLPERFHIALEHDWESLGAYGALLFDNGQSGTGRSWVKCQSLYWPFNYEWKTVKDYYSDVYSLNFDPNLLIRVILDSPSSSPPVSPTLISPADGADVAENQVTFSWSTSSGADRYFLEVNSSSLWAESTSLYCAQVNGTSQIVTGFPNNGTTYYWRVLAGNADAWSDASIPRSFVNGGTQECSVWGDVIAKYNDYVSGQATWADVITCYNSYVM